MKSGVYKGKLGNFKIKKTKGKTPINGLNKPFIGVRAWQGQKDLNPRHAVLETAALPTELYP